jgi:hypothetical protein
LAANAATGTAVTNTATLPANQFGRQRRQPVDLILGPAVFNRHVLVFDTGVFEALAECA